MRNLYTWLFRAAVPLILLRLWWRGRREPAYRQRLRERLGRVPVRASRAPLIWVHSVSVGETLAAVPVIEQLAARHPHWQWLVTTTTPTGSERVGAALKPLLGGRLLHYYLPYDLPECLRPFLDALRPNLLVIIETELWPNLLALCAERGMPTLLANARLSEKSARGYGRFPRLTRAMLNNLTRVVAQYPADAGRFVELGLPQERVVVSGNIKFDLDIDLGMVSEAQALAHQWRGRDHRRVWLAASTHAGEEEVVLDAFARLRCGHKSFEDLLLVLVPRHPQRFDDVARLCRDRGFRLLRRSDGGPPGPEHQVLLGDTMGELLKFYGACELAFVGGSLVPVGGHNMIEPAAWGVPVICGPHLHNFAAVAELLSRVGALAVVEDAEKLAQQVRKWLEDDRARRSAGARGRDVAQENSGALLRLLEEIEKLQESAFRGVAD
ncbi:lipid IV(A) 3-deoxy-D-manno-octulosonic acid transferase [Microbulbifer thermotolerans]|uniref:3-deoxy-D-manno-octulosonic acid transferase n=1 Tax=Microbulbifer thermotolerans TaxID=252514 RepID=A0A143HPU6_MICTH|nr:lipid IV(A) 3-deoxy-D-manno-octulosonic acid transferase [Microbulbifer thermotolerans]AMX03521.1 3-deoxy-D-manno-octulosonic acid transferase [Microbulbifer thermotolerans]MCX2778143.1 lipid IV(A) 3-deoxy-D-manno-octulosonic acid transferase [Microbulbifer thermotolerans]MCX2782223.1 lipid IV(A) 3-deoxy-D-manno-octulosonic acid transferase [Microbulbifer thermotolerans]MCX2795315.1 lipid IV(A) 3-deoxy-D-manno-octulosonic acid transferase [Microbulbifer thermotolerans]MCX2801123.1 lipid IV(